MSKYNYDFLNDDHIDSSNNNSNNIDISILDSDDDEKEKEKLNRLDKEKEKQKKKNHTRNNSNSYRNKNLINDALKDYKLNITSNDDNSLKLKIQNNDDNKNKNKSPSISSVPNFLTSESNDIGLGIDSVTPSTITSLLNNYQNHKLQLQLQLQDEINQNKKDEKVDETTIINMSAINDEFTQTTSSISSVNITNNQSNSKRTSFISTTSNDLRLIKTPISDTKVNIIGNNDAKQLRTPVTESRASFSINKASSPPIYQRAPTLGSAILMQVLPSITPNVNTASEPKSFDLSEIPKLPLKLIETLTSDFKSNSSRFNDMKFNDSKQNDKYEEYKFSSKKYAESNFEPEKNETYFESPRFVNETSPRSSPRVLNTKARIKNVLNDYEQSNRSFGSYDSESRYTEELIKTQRYYDERLDRLTRKYNNLVASSKQERETLQKKIESEANRRIDNIIDKVKLDEEDLKRRQDFEVLKLSSEYNALVEKNTKAASEMKSFYENEMKILTNKQKLETDSTLFAAKKHYESEIMRISAAFESQLSRNEKMLREQRALMEVEFRRLQDEHMRLSLDKNNGSAEITRYYNSEIQRLVSEYADRESVLKNEFEKDLKQSKMDTDAKQKEIEFLTSEIAKKDGEWNDEIDSNEKRQLLFTQQINELRTENEQHVKKNNELRQIMAKQIANINPTMSRIPDPQNDAALAALINDQNEERDRLEEEVETLTRTLSDLQPRFEELTHKYHEEEVKIFHLEEDLLNKDKRIEEFVSLLEQERTDLEETVLALDESIDRIKKLDAELKLKKEENVTLKGQVDTMSKELAATKVEIKETKNKLEDSKVSIVDMKKDFKATESKITGFENQIRQLIGELKQAEGKAEKEKSLRLQVERDLEISKNNAALLLNKQPEIRQSRQSLPSNINSSNSNITNNNNFVPSIKISSRDQYNSSSMDSVLKYPDDSNLNRNRNISNRYSQEDERFNYDNQKRNDGSPFKQKNNDEFNYHQRNNYESNFQQRNNDDSNSQQFRNNDPIYFSKNNNEGNYQRFNSQFDEGSSNIKKTFANEENIRIIEDDRYSTKNSSYQAESHSKPKFFKSAQKIIEEPSNSMKFNSNNSFIPDDDDEVERMIAQLEAQNRELKNEQFARPTTNAPFANEFNASVNNKKDAMETNLLKLNMEKESLELELSKLAPNPRTMAMKKHKISLETKVQMLEEDINQIKKEFRLINK